MQGYDEQDLHDPPESALGVPA